MNSMNTTYDPDTYDPNLENYELRKVVEYGIKI